MTGEGTGGRGARGDEEVGEAVGGAATSSMDSGRKLACVIEIDGTSTVALRACRRTMGFEGDGAALSDSTPASSLLSQNSGGMPNRLLVLALHMLPPLIVGIPKRRSDVDAVFADTGVNEPMVDCGSACKDTVVLAFGCPHMRSKMLDAVERMLLALDLCDMGDDTPEEIVSIVLERGNPTEDCFMSIPPNRSWRMFLKAT